MKYYKGDRTIDGIVVTVNEKSLDQRLDVATFTDQGFEWAYVGNEPRQLALALLLDYGVSDQSAITLSQAYMYRITAKLDNTWVLSTEDIESVLAEINAQPPEEKDS